MPGAAMKSDGQVLMDELREDHRNMSVILNMIDDIVSEVQAGEDPDFQLLGEIMRYMTVYPDAVHHPKEDVVYERLRNERTDLAEGLDDVPKDHAAIAELGLRLRNDVEAVNAGTAVRRKTLIDDASDYARRLRRHMQWEEEDLFLRIDSMLDAAPQQFDVSKYPSNKDPIFGLPADGGFRRMRSGL